MGMILEGGLGPKYEHLKSIISNLGSCVIGFSGGVDSTLLFAVAVDILGDRAVAVTATAATYPQRELREAQELAVLIGGQHCIIVSEELDIPEFKDNPRDRCYYCKKELFGKLRTIADEQGLRHVLDGTNLDDRGDHRPGRRAAVEYNVRSPLDEAGLTKKEIRALSHALNLPTWDKPAFACLSSRFPYGISITAERVRKVGDAEESLRKLGFKTIRVRYHGDVARLELGPQEFAEAMGPLRNQVESFVRQAGFTYVAVDLQGYRSGSMNEV